MKNTTLKVPSSFEMDFHVHSCYSPDSLLKPARIIKAAKKRGLSGVVVTDHNTVKGGIETRKLVREDNFIVIVGAEIATDIGDVIGLFIEQEIKSRDFVGVVAEIKQQGGIVVLPHPYRTFRFSSNIDSKIITNVDIIEGFNARSKSDGFNLRACELAVRVGKPVTGGSDAHFANEVGNGRTVFHNIPLTLDAIRTALLENKSGIVGNILPFPLYALYMFGIGRGIRFLKFIRNGRATV